MLRKTFQIILLTLMLLGLPVLGLVLSGKPLSPYFKFPPATMFAHRAPFSWWAFSGYTLFIAGCITPFILQGLRKPGVSTPSISRLGIFPRWGGLGATLGLCAWILAWSRFPWFRPFQAHTFTPLWLSYILFVNALTFRRTGQCLMIDQPGRFALLFPASAAFWWFFEYLNRFVQNWHYIGVGFQAWEYFLCATLSFSTVLPAAMSTREWLLTFPRMRTNFAAFFPIPLPYPKFWAACLLCAAAAGLVGLAILPNHLYSLVWLSPLLIMVCLQAIMNEPTLFSSVARGDWRGLLSCALAALICGFFWEMWNYFSLARWTYSVPFVQRFHVFEMPILGYAGYLPFGVTCCVVSEMVLGEMKSARADFI